VLAPVNGLFGSTNKIIVIIRNDIKNQTVSSKFILKFKNFPKSVYSPWILRRPKPTVRPVKVKAHITPAVVNISFAIII